MRTFNRRELIGSIGIAAGGCAFLSCLFGKGAPKEAGDKKTVEILNRNCGGEFTAAHGLSKKVKVCRSCHDKGSDRRDTRGKMDCMRCHTSLDENHPK